MNQKKKLRQLEEENEDDKNFIDDTHDKLKNKLPHRYVDSDEDNEDDGGNQINLDKFLVNKPRGNVKGKQGIDLSNIDIEEVVNDNVKIVEINKPIQNKEERMLQEFDLEIQPKKQQIEEEIDLDEIEELIKEAEAKKQQQQSTQIVKKPQPIHKTTKLVLQGAQINQSLLPEKQLYQPYDNQLSNIQEENKSIKFYWIDIYEDTLNSKGELFLFGKVKNTKLNDYVPCTVYIPNFRKVVYLYCDGEYSYQDLLFECEKIMGQMLGLRKDEYSAELVEREYAFEIDEIPTSKCKYLKVSYPQRGERQLPLKLPGSYLFKYALQSTQSSIEQFVVNNNIRGPQWLTIKRYQLLEIRNTQFRLNSKYNIQCEENWIEVSQLQGPSPPLHIMSLSLQGYLKDKEEQLIMISIAYQNNIDQDGKEAEEIINYKTLVCMPKGMQWPIDYQKGFVQEFDDEHGMISMFFNLVEKYDPDAIVGHDLNQNLLIKLLARTQKLKIYTWNRMSRLQKCKTLPKHPNQKIRILTIGRLLVDTYQMAKDLTKAESYELGKLGEKFVNQKCLKVESDTAEDYLDAFQNITNLIKYNQDATRITIKVMEKLQIISLTKSLTNICGNTWNRSLQNQRAERNEYLLMHEFSAKGFILPDAIQKLDREEEDNKQYAGGMVFEPIPDIYNDYILLLDFNSLYPSIIREYNICFTTVIRKKISLTNSYQKIDQPQKDIKKKKNDKKTEQEDDLKDDQPNTEGVVDTSQGPGILPEIITKLIETRLKAKKKMNQCQGLDKQIWNIKQLAFKLVANSIYGCLGFKSSRFYSVGIASLITKQGRQILQDSKKRVEKHHQVVYGDTDSVMIKPNIKGNNLEEVLKVAEEIQKEINSQYKKLRIGLDGLFRTLLLLKKKKYAGIKVTNLDDLFTLYQNNRKFNYSQPLQPKFEQEIKGIDLVRREFCKLSKNVQTHLLDILLNETVRDQLYDNVYQLMMECNQIITRSKNKEELLENKYLKTPANVSDFIINKQLNKAPHEYQDTKSNPHVCVAKRLIEQGKRTPESLVNHVISYIITRNDNEPSVAYRAFTPEEVQELNLEIDYHYYLQHQIFDTVERLCKNIDGLLLSRIAENLGLEYHKKQIQYSTDHKATNLDSVRESCLEELSFQCHQCKELQSYSSLYNAEKKEFNYPLQCPKCSQLLGINFKNQTKILIKNLCDQYHMGLVKCKADKEPQYCISINKQCFGTCNCRKQFKYQIQEKWINLQIKLLEKMLGRELIKKPYLMINLQDKFMKLNLQ